MQSQSTVDRSAFLIIGAMKSGTTSLAESLVSQTNTLFPCGKEPIVLSEPDEDVYQEKIRNYVQQMNAAEAGMVVGDASPQLTFRDDLAARRALDVFGSGLKLIYIVRDPIARAVSHFQHAWQGGWQMAATADDAFAHEPMLYEVSCYRKQLAKWEQVFGESCSMVIRFEDMIKDPQGYLDRVCSHIGVNPKGGTLELAHSNQAGEQGQPILPGPLWGLLQKTKKSAFVHGLVRSSVGVKVKGAMLKSDPPPKASRQALEAFAQRLEGETKRFYEHVGWDDTHRWDFEQTVEKLCK